MNYSIYASSQECISVNYADYLYKKGEYYRAISEYDRYLYFKANTITDSTYCFKQIVKCYYRGEEYENAISYLDSVRPFTKANYELLNELNRYEGLSYLQLGYPRLSISYFEQNTDKLESELLIGITYLYLSEWDKAYNKFYSLSEYETKQEVYPFKKLYLVAQEGKRLKRKSPLLAGILGIMPGCGYVYTESYQTALSSIIINGLLLGTTYELHKNNLNIAGSTSILLAFSFYVGNIYGSISSAYRYNHLKDKEFIEMSLKEYRELIEE